MTQSPQGAAFLAMREQFAKEFALTQRGRKRILAQLAKYDDMLYTVYRPHVVGETLQVANEVLRKYEAERPDAVLSDGAEAEPLRTNIAQRTAIKDVLVALSGLITTNTPEAADAKAATA